ncbi:MAG: PAS domain S-box protein, partial [Chloroflexota bacterium]
MTWSYVYTPHIWPSVFTTLLLIVLASYAWYHRSVPGALPFAIGCLAGALWMAGYGMEVAAIGTAGKIFWVKFQAIWQLPGVTAITCFILEYAWPGRWITRRVLVIFSLPLLLLLALALTNNIHHLLWLDFIIDGTVTPIRAPVLWLFIFYGYLLFIINISVLVWLYSRSPPHRWPVAILLTSQVGIRSLYILNFANIQRSDIPIDVIGISILILGYAIVLFGFRILDPVTMAQQALIERMHDSLLVLDLQGRVETLNPAAERLFCTSNAEVKGKPVSELLPGLLDEHPAETAESEIELSLEIKQGDSTQEIRHYTLTNSLLKDFRDLKVGRLLLLHDITTQKQAQQQILEQQRALAMLNERTRLARELHDSVGQVLGYVSMQAQAI